MSEGPRHRPWLWAASSLGVIAAGLAVLVSAPGETADARRYEREVDSIRPEPAVVQDRYRSATRRRDHYLRLRLAGGTVRVVELESSVDWDTFEEGREIEVTVWEGRVTRVRRPGREPVETVASPVHRRAAAVVLPIVLLPAGAFGLWAAFRYRRSSGSWTAKAPPLTGPVSLRRSVGCLTVAAATVTPLLLLSMAIYDVTGIVLLTIMASLVGAGAGALLWTVGRIVRRSRGDNDRGDNDRGEHDDDEDGDDEDED